MDAVNFRAAAKASLGLWASEVALEQSSYFARFLARKWTPEEEAAWEAKMADERRRREADDVKMQAFLGELQALCLKHGAKVGGHEEGFWCFLGSSNLESLDVEPDRLTFKLD